MIQQSTGIILAVAVLINFAVLISTVVGVDGTGPLALFGVCVSLLALYLVFEDLEWIKGK